MLSTLSSTAGELPISSMRSLASSAQNHTGYSKTFMPIVSQGSKPSVLWASHGMSDSAMLGEGNRLLKLGVWGPDLVACHHLLCK
jgi:hypothetical protein